MTPLRASAILLLLATWLPAQDAATLMSEAESHYQKRGQAGFIEKAISLFEKALAADPAGYAAAWRLSRACWYAAKHASHDQQEAWFQKGIAAGKKAESIDAHGCEGYFWTGVNQALWAEHSGMFKALGLVDDIKMALNTSMELNPDCECAGPQRALGKLYSKIPWFKGGSKSKAISHLEESLERCPNDTQSRMFLAEIYLDQDKKAAAIQQLQLVLKQEPDPDWLPETIENKKIAAKILDDIRK